MPILLAALVFLGTTIVPSADVTPLEVKITIAPSTDDPLLLLRRPTPDTYTCDALAIEPGTNRAFALARVIAAPGIREKTTAKGAGVDIEFSVLISRTGDRADTKITVTKDGKVVARQSSAVRLLNTVTSRYRPLH